MNYDATKSYSLHKIQARSDYWRRFNGLIDLYLISGPLLAREGARTWQLWNNNYQIATSYSSSQNTRTVIWNVFSACILNLCSTCRALFLVLLIECYLVSKSNQLLLQKKHERRCTDKGVLKWYEIHIKLLRKRWIFVHISKFSIIYCVNFDCN